MKNNKQSDSNNSRRLATPEETAKNQLKTDFFIEKNRNDTPALNPTTQNPEA
jgi:hypothetical protein